MNENKFHRVVLLIGFALSSLFISPPSLSYVQDVSDFPLTEVPFTAQNDVKIRYLIDPTGTKSLKEIKEMPREFIESNNTVSLGYISDPIWFDVELPELPKGKYFVHLSYFAAPKLDAFLNTHGQEFIEYNYGAEQNYTNRPVLSNEVLVPIKIDAKNIGKNIGLFFRVESYASFSFKITVHEQRSYSLRNELETIFIWLILGGMLALALYNLFLYFSLRATEYLFYTLYVLSFFCSQIVLGGHGYQYLWPGSGWINPIASMVTLALVASTATFFAKAFLNTKNLTPRFDRFLLSIPIFSLLLLVAIPFFEPQTYILGSLFLANLLIFSIIALGAYHLYLGNYRARFFVVAWIFFFGGASITVFMYQGMVPANFFTFNAAKIGGFLEAVFLALALADKINFIEKEKRIAEEHVKDALQQKNKALKSANQLKDRFMATMSHELRTPLNGIIGAIELIQSDKHSEANIEKLTHAAGQASDHLKSLLDQILEYTDLQSGQYQLILEEFEWVPWLVNVASWKEKYQEKGIEFVIDDSVEEPWIISDRFVLRKILNQLLDNSLRFSEQGTVKLISKLKVGRSSHLADLVITVADQGVGMPEQDIDWLTQGFSQLEQSSHRFHGGLGIGLGLCQAWVETLNGKLEIQSKLGKGTEITLSVPIKLPDHPAIKIPETVSVPEKVAYNRVLVVEDNLVNQTIMTGLLEKLGKEVLVADHGKHALDIIESQPNIDLIFMDCEMPVMDGYDATRNIRRRNDKFKFIPIIAVTANAMSSDRQKCLAAGMNDYLAKPVKIKLIEKILTKWAGQA